jgi:hypothetical protein
MHDWTLLSIFFDWGTGNAALAFRRSGSELVSVQAEGVSNLQVPRMNEWGKSVSVNEVRGPSKDVGGRQTLEIEMQSGDLIKITALSFIFPSEYVYLCRQ